MNTVEASFITTLRQVTEMCQWHKCVRTKRPKSISEKNPSPRTICFSNVSLLDKTSCMSNSLMQSSRKTFFRFLNPWQNSMLNFHYKINLPQIPNLPGQLVQWKQCFILHVVFLLQDCNDFMTSQNLECKTLKMRCNWCACSSNIAY